MDRRTDGQIDGQMDGWMDRGMDGWMDGWMDGRTDGRMDGRTDGRTDRQTKRQQENRDLHIYPCKKKLVIVTQGTIWAETRKQVAQTLHAQFLPSDITGLFPFLNTM